MQAVGAFATGTQRCTKDNITEQVKWVGVGLIRSSSQGGESNTFLFEQGNDFGSSLWVSPLCTQSGGIWIECAYLLGCVIGQLDEMQALPVGVEGINALGCYIYLFAIVVVLVSFF